MKTKKEFSKIVMGSMVVSYFIGLVFGMAIISLLISYSSSSVYMALGAFFTYIATPVSVATGFYSKKAKEENLLKIKNSQLLQEVELVKNTKETLEDIFDRDDDDYCDEEKEDE